MVVAKITAAIGCTKMFHFGMNPPQYPTCVPITASKFSEPTVTSTVINDSASGTSYDSICAVARSPPRNEYFDPDAHPPSTTPYVARPAQASATSTPAEVFDTITGKFSGNFHSPSTDV